jgi:hypothetical protein
MIDGFKNDKFSIVDTSIFAEEIPYIGRHVKYHPKNFVLKAHEKITNELNLAEVYDFSNSQLDVDYKVSFESHTLVCTDSKYEECVGKTFYDELMLNLVD